jgi:hypothetical protein
MSVIPILKDSCESAMKEIGIRDLEFVKREE